MEWLRANYDRAAVFAAALFLVLCAAFIYLRAAGFDERFDALRTAPAPNEHLPPDKGTELAGALAQLHAPPQWTFSGRSGLFVPEKHFIAANGQPATLQNTMLHPPVPNEWLEEYGLAITEGDVLSQDPDGDGFTNLDEWEGHTNPTEKNSHPPYTSKLKLKAYSEETFPLIFSSSVGDTFAINDVDRKMPTQFLKVGDLVKGTKYKLAGHTEKFDTDKYGTTIDVSELTLEQTDTHDRVTLVKERPSTSPESVATFLYTWNGMEQTLSVKKDQEFSLKPEEQIKYKLLDVQPGKATIINIQQPQKKIEIGPVP